MSKFSITGSVLNEASKQKAIDNYKIDFLSIHNIVTNDFNFYNVDDVEELKDSILQSGLQQPLVVIVSGDNYKIISGHRRFKAISEINAAQPEKFELVPCHIIQSRTPAADKLALITANSTSRELTDFEKIEQVRLTKDVLNQLKNEGFKLSGRQRQIIATELKMSETQVQRFDYINKNLIDEYKNELKNENIPVSVADEISHLPASEQKKLYKTKKTNVTLDIIHNNKKFQPKKKQENLVVEVKTEPASEKIKQDENEDDIFAAKVKTSQAIRVISSLCNEVNFYDSIDKKILDDILVQLNDLQEKYSQIFNSLNER